MSMLRPGMALIGAFVLLAACTETQPILQGARELPRGGPADTSFVENQSRPAALGPQTRNTAWSQSTATPATRTDHAALAAALTEVWRAPVGKGDNRRGRITADPVAADGRIFTLDSEATVTATSASGSTLWQTDVTPVRDDAGQTTGGALALGGGRVYVTSAFGRVVALDPATGQEIWTQQLGTTGTGAPTFYDGVLYLVAGDTTAWALEADSGRIRWQIDGVADLNNVMGGPAPAVTAQRVVFGFGSGDLQAAFRQGGLRLWNALLAGQRDGFAVATVDDITGDPVVYGDYVYAGNFSGSFAALNLASGDRRWTADMGAVGPAWVTADSVYLVSDLLDLVRLDAVTGEVVWRSPLPGYVDRRRPQVRRDRATVNHGPILAGGRLVVASSDGLIRSFDPVTGELIGSTPIRGGATTAPIVVDGTLYVVSSDGQLHAFR